MDFKGIKIEWMGHSAFRITGKQSVYIDPFKLKAGFEKADMILITHTHHDHLSLADIQPLLGEKTWLFCPVDAPSKLGKLGSDIKFHIVHPGETIRQNNVSITGFPAYNINKGFHPKENNWLGYLIEIDGVKIFHAGDTDAIPELKALKGIDILLLPVGGTYTMHAEEAASVANFLMPGVAIPMHYGTLVGQGADAEKFKRLAKCPVEILGNL